MKTIITIFAIAICTTSLFAQSVTFSLNWNSESSFYELYVTRDTTAETPPTVAGTASVTIVFPTDGVSGTRTLAHTSESVSNFNPAGVIRSPAAASENDFYVFNSTGGANYVGVLEADVAVLWMTFTPSDGNSEARLFENDTDPDSSGEGMLGINALSSFYVISLAGAVNEYTGNTTLNTTFNEMLDVSIFPNPATDKVYIMSKNPIDSVEIYDVLGKQVNVFRHRNELNISELNSGIYLFKIRSGDQILTKKIVVE
ncbi:T9SS type A sorting domain-containing protein [Winogradskyella bathintestinalis]|uniref:T9SS type A sorting domain-containing protein n=1 Tax=Winogradskyella bathintestinalis TaxID=3035208 RepID=A0ABT7ZWS2_9FLAO|nr:T9SS type A sorting domain-containing protein [Winogradskyella bathintestinalis]MDN3493459.1 T9SS type A sorting domain-containing protein [Winogradskyella bathintestinalis]